MYISKRVKSTAAPTIADLSELAARLRAQGRDVISLGQGVADFAPPPAAIAAAGAALEKRVTHFYSPDPGLLELRQAIARKWSRDAGVAVDAEREIIVTAGGNQAAVLALLACADPGDEVILPAPYYFNHQMARHLCGLVAVEAPLDEGNGFGVTWERIEPYVTSRTRVVIICTPSNPTGAVVQREELIRCARELIGRGITPIMDETYEYLVYEGARHFSLAAEAEFRPHVITLGSFSKTFGMAGWRVGYMFAPAELVTQGIKVQDTLVICAPVISQQAVAAALDADYKARLAGQITELERRRAALRAGLEEIPRLSWRVTYGAMFAFVRVEDGPAVDWLAEDLIREAGVQTLPGTAFGACGAGYLRVSYGAAPVPVLQEALGRLRDYFNRLS